MKIKTAAREHQNPQLEEGPLRRPKKSLHWHAPQIPKAKRAKGISTNNGNDPRRGRVHSGCSTCPSEVELIGNKAPYAEILATAGKPTRIFRPPRVGEFQFGRDPNLDPE